MRLKIRKLLYSDLFHLINPSQIGMSLTESYAMLPTAAVSGFYFSHPEAHYFGTGKILDDQIIDYAKRRGVSEEQAKQDLAPILAN